MRAARQYFFVKVPGTLFKVYLSITWWNMVKKGSLGDSLLASPLERVAKGLFLAGVLCLCCAIARPALAAESDSRPLQSRFLRTAGYLQHADSALRSAFVSLALSELSRAYRDEVTLARKESRSAQADKGLSGWSRSVAGYAGELQRLVDDVEMGLPVSLVVEDRKPLALFVSRRFLILSHPRPLQQRLFEHRVLEQFCARYRCEQFLPGEVGSGPIPIARASVSPNWHFGQGLWSCSHRGIRVEFKYQSKISTAKTICEELMREVLALADEVAWEVIHAVEVDWDGLAIEVAPGATQHILPLNASGDTVLATLPLLHSTPGLFDSVLPWIRAWVTRRVDTQIELRAEDFGWQGS